MNDHRTGRLLGLCRHVLPRTDQAEAVERAQPERVRRVRFRSRTQCSYMNSRSFAGLGGSLRGFGGVRCKEGHAACDDAPEDFDEMVLALRAAALRPAELEREEGNLRLGPVAREAAACR